MRVPLALARGGGNKEISRGRGGVWGAATILTLAYRTSPSVAAGVAAIALLSKWTSLLFHFFKEIFLSIKSFIG